MLSGAAWLLLWVLRRLQRQRAGLGSFRIAAWHRESLPARQSSQRGAGGLGRGCDVYAYGLPGSAADDWPTGRECTAGHAERLSDRHSGIAERCAGEAVEGAAGRAERSGDCARRGSAAEVSEWHASGSAESAKASNGDFCKRERSPGTTSDRTLSKW